jgi:amino acid adenylation domain-containing protein
MLYLLHQIIDRSAITHPDKAAFSYDRETLNYSDLRMQANGLAAALLNKGVVPGDRVGLLLPKSLQTPVAVFGCLKAGAVIVPLDPQSPADRLSLMIRDAGIRQLIVLPEQSRRVEKLCATEALDIRLVVGLTAPTSTVRSVIAWDELKPEDCAPTIVLQEDDPAYLLYTSGSTGQPKGIVHSHRSGLAYARLSADAYGVSSDDTLGNFAPLHFDQSTFDFYTGPLRAATTVLIPQAFGFATASLANLIEEEQLSIWYSVPSVLIQLILRDALIGKNLSELRWVLFGGEPFPPKHLSRLMALMPGARFSNVYGPTEVNQCTYFNVRGDQPVEEALPIGRVWENTESLIVDGDDQIVAPGDTGELLIRSPTMMLGYWGRPDLNERAFYMRKRDGALADRFYRTGDLVRDKGDGELEFLGRKDRQIKTSGHRVELDEIEAVLCQHDDVEEAATFTVEDDDQGVLIEAAVILRLGATTSNKEVTRHAASLLPGYAVPRKILLLTEFPRTRTGKVDRAALAAASVQGKQPSR